MHFNFKQLSHIDLPTSLTSSRGVVTPCKCHSRCDTIGRFHLPGPPQGPGGSYQEDEVGSDCTWVDS